LAAAAQASLEGAVISTPISPAIASATAAPMRNWVFIFMGPPPLLLAGSGKHRCEPCEASRMCERIIAGTKPMSADAEACPRRIWSGSFASARRVDPN